MVSAFQSMSNLRLSGSRFTVRYWNFRVRYWKHGLGPEDTEVLKLLATWVTQVYHPMFYEIKMNHEIKLGPGI